MPLVHTLGKPKRKSRYQSPWTFWSASAQMLNTLKRSNKTCFIFVPRAAILLVNYPWRWPNASQVWRPVVFAINLTNFVCRLFSPGRCFISSPHSTHHRRVQEKIPRLNVQARTCLEHLSFFCNAEETAGEFKWWSNESGRTGRTFLGAK